jgi:peptide-methionine (S)-S-oxide reductase
MKRIWLVAVALIAAVLAAPILVAQQTPAPSAATAAGPPPEGLAVATFGSGCFWCTESDFDQVPGVVKTISGYMGGMTLNPTYREVSTGKTGHVEVLQVTYDPKVVSYDKLLDQFWHTTDIVDGGGQFCDRGNQYRPAIFAHTDEQFQLATAGKEALDKSGRFTAPVAVQISRTGEFTPAEDYHQDYYKNNALKYKIYRLGCGRDARLKQLWGGEAKTH